MFKNVLRFCTDLYASDVFVLRKKKQDKAWTYASEQFDCIFSFFCHNFVFENYAIVITEA